MTSEIILVTSETICVGVDDRKTVMNKKAFDGFEKIFPITPDYPMVMMVNGPSYFAGQSLEKLNEEFSHRGCPLIRFKFCNTCVGWGITIF